MLIKTKPLNTPTAPTVAATPQYGLAVEHDVLKFQLDNQVAADLEVTTDGKVATLTLYSKNRTILSGPHDFDIECLQGELYEVVLIEQTKEILFKFSKGATVRCDISLIFDKLDQLRSDLTESCSNLDEKITTTKEELLTTISEVEASLNEVDEVLSAKITSTAENLTTEFDTKLDTLNTTINGRIDDVEKNFKEDLSETTKTLNSTIDSTKKDLVSQLTETKKALTEEINKKADITTLNEKFKELINTIAAAKNDVKNYVDKQDASLESSFKSLITSIKELIQTTKADIDTKITAVYKFKGTVETYAKLPTEGLVVGDVYNITAASPEHNIAAGDNVAWEGTKWDRLAGTIAVEDSLSATSTNPITSKAVYEALQEGITIDGDWGKTTVGVGGLPAGTDMSGKTVLDILNSILFPYVALTGLSISLNPSTTTLIEKGKTVTLTSVSASVIKGSKPIESLKLFKDDVLLTENTDATSISYTFDDLSFTEELSPSFSAEVSDGTTSLTKTASTYTWCYKSYYGVVGSSETEPNETAIKALTSALYTRATRNLTFDMNGQKCIYAYPASYGNLSAIYDANNFLVTNSFNKYTISITNSYGKTTDYIVYILDGSTTATMTYKFQF